MKILTLKVFFLKASKTAVTIARQNITTSLAKLKKWTIKIEELESDLSNHFFQNQINEIFKIIGPEAAKFVEEKSNIETEINAAEEKQKQLQVDIEWQAG